MTDLNVSRAAVPIWRLGPENEEVRSLLGTGFFVGGPSALVTAAHVFLDNVLADDEAYGFMFLPPTGRPRIGRFRDYVAHETFDVAVVAADSVPGAIALSVAESEVSCNLDVLTFEFSQTTIHDDAERLRVKASPFTHKGNVLRHYISHFPEREPTRVLDTSFPALQGASGAPVLRAHDYAVVGMLVANHERHLLPAQVLRVEAGSDTSEEVRYFLPTGKALSPLVLKKCLQELGANPRIVP